MHRITSASLIAILASGCVVGGRLTPAQLRARVGTGSAPPPPPAATPAPTASTASAGAPTAPLPDGCYEEFGQDAAPEHHRATRIEPGVIDGCIEEYDHDYFRLQAPVGEGLVLYQFAIDKEKSPTIIVRDADGKSHLHESPDLPRRAWAVVEPGTNFFVSMYSSWSGPYRVVVDESFVSDPDEPNDTIEQATRLRLGQAHEGILASAVNDIDRRVDVYRIDVPRPGTVHVDVLEAASGIDFEIEILNMDRERITSMYAANKGANLREDVEIREAGTYFLLLNHSDNWEVPVAGEGEPPLRLTKPYTITATLK